MKLASAITLFLVVFQFGSERVVAELKAGAQGVCLTMIAVEEELASVPAQASAERMPDYQHA